MPITLVSIRSLRWIRVIRGDVKCQKSNVKSGVEAGTPHLMLGLSVRCFPELLGILTCGAGGRHVDGGRGFGGVAFRGALSRGLVGVGDDGEGGEYVADGGGVGLRL